MQDDPVRQIITTAPPGSVIVICNTSSEEAAELRELMAAWEPPDDGKEQLVICIPDDRPVRVLDEQAMARSGWYRDNADGDEDD